MDIGNIEELMDDLADFADEAKEIQNAISTSFATPEGFDEAEFENEFAALEEEIKMESLAGLSQPSATRPHRCPLLQAHLRHQRLRQMPLQ